MTAETRDYLAELKAANEPALALMYDAGTYINYLRSVIRDMLPYFPKDHPYHVGFSEAAAGKATARHMPQAGDACDLCQRTWVQLPNAGLWHECMPKRATP